MTEHVPLQVNSSTYTKRMNIIDTLKKIFMQDLFILNKVTGINLPQCAIFRWQAGVFAVISITAYNV